MLLQRDGKARMISNLAVLLLIFQVTERQAWPWKGYGKQLYKASLRLTQDRLLPSSNCDWNSFKESVLSWLFIPPLPLWSTCFTWTCCLHCCRPHNLLYRAPCVSFNSEGTCPCPVSTCVLFPQWTTLDLISFCFVFWPLIRFCLDSEAVLT